MRIIEPMLRGKYLDQRLCEEGIFIGDLSHYNMMMGIKESEVESDDINI